MSVYDTLSTPNVNTIPRECFALEVNIDTVILSEMDTGFKQPIFYVVSSNKSAKKFLNDNNICFKEIDKIEDAMKTSDYDVIDTYKLMYGADQKYSEFFEKPYINDIETLMNVSARIDRLDDISFGKNKLDTTKFRELNIMEYPCVHKYVYDIYIR